MSSALFVYLTSLYPGQSREFSRGEGVRNLIIAWPNNMVKWHQPTIVDIKHYIRLNGERVCVLVLRICVSWVSSIA